MVVVGASAAGLGGIITIVHQVATYRRIAVNELSMQAQIVGENCGAALEFDTPHNANETLASLKARADIVAAYVYRKNGSVFAVYQAKPGVLSPYPPSELGGEHFENGQLRLYRPIIRSGETLGTVFLHSNLQPQYSQLKAGVWISVATTSVATILAIGLAMWLQGVISRPVLNLAVVASRVENDGDYSLRGRKDGNDEIGALTDRFNHMLAAIQERDVKLRRLSLQIMKAQDVERRRIARELHDVTGQHLVGAEIALSHLMRSDALLPEKARQQLVRARELVEQSMQEIRTQSYLLYPPLLDELGLAAAMKQYIQGVAERSELDVELEFPPDFGRFSPEIELALFRVLQESLTNIQKHSGSSSAKICFVLKPGKLAMEVHDTGKGFRLAGSLNDRGAPMGVGVLSMRERIEELGGELNIQSGPNGTTVQAVLPITGGIK